MSVLTDPASFLSPSETSKRADFRVFRGRAVRGRGLAGPGPGGTMPVCGVYRAVFWGHFGVGFGGRFGRAGLAGGGHFDRF